MILVFWIVVGVGVFLFLAKPSGAGSSPSLFVLPTVSATDLSRIDPAMQTMVVNADMLVRQYLTLLKEGRPPKTIRDGNELPASQKAIANAILAITLFWSAKKSFNKYLYVGLRDTYSSLAYFRPRIGDAVAHWGLSDRSNEDLLRAARLVIHAYGDREYTLSDAEKEAARLKVEFDKDVEAMLIEASQGR